MLTQVLASCPKYKDLKYSEDGWTINEVTKFQILLCLCMDLGA